MTDATNETDAPDAVAAAPEPPSPRAAATIVWILTEGQRCATLPDLLGAFCRHLRSIGIPVDRSTIHVRLLHPLLRGLTWIWRDDRPDIERVERFHGTEQSPEFLRSPVYPIMELGSEGYRHHMEASPGPQPFPILEDLVAEAFTDYGAMPLSFSSGRRNVLTIATRRVGGFGTDDLALIYEALPALTALAEARMLRLLATNLLNTYVGPEAGQRILDGDIRRGTSLGIGAVLWYCDLRGFTALADRLPMEELVALLNTYFEVMGGPVSRRGGEILKFIGDAMLAIFPVPPAADASMVSTRCVLALEAALEAMEGLDRLNGLRTGRGEPGLGVGIALHVGEVMYGNIGAPARLDFTVIGPAVNLVTRLEALTRRLDQRLLTSAAFARAIDGRNGVLALRSHGLHPLKGLREPVEVFGPPLRS